ncbi:MAG: peptidase [Acidobacteria bacterium]|nr:MAG: peptidase [Acidobacteriota bacterium]
MKLANSLILTGQTEEHLCQPDEKNALAKPIHKEALNAFMELRKDAAKQGFDLQIDSGFRSFEQQLSIWNRKATGQLAVLDSQAVPLDITKLTEEELIFSILRWSALPGASRHHWGTDIDVSDANATPEGYEIEQIPEEVNDDGMFGPLHRWLDEQMAANKSHGFFRPYDADRNGVAPERWHLSYQPVSEEYISLLTVDLLHETLSHADIELKSTLLDKLDEIYDRFVLNIGAYLS